MRPRQRSRVSWLVVGLGFSACSREDPAVAAPESVPSVVSASASASASAAPKPPPEPPKLETVTPVIREVPELENDFTLHTIEGAVMVANKERVGRLLPEGRVDWVGQIPKGSDFVGPNEIRWVIGSWPDDVAVYYTSVNGRAPMPTYFPITGGGGWYTFAPGGGGGWLAGVARSGETTTIAGWDTADGYRVVKVKGPMAKPAFRLASQEGCKPPSPNSFDSRQPKPAVSPLAYAATRAGTILSLGTYCKDDTVALEVWKKANEPSRIISVAKWLPDRDEIYRAELLSGRDDTTFIVAGPKRPILRYRDGEIAPLPRLKRPHKDAFVSPEGTLYAFDGITLFELADDAFKPALQFAWPTEIDLAKHGEQFIGKRLGKLHALKETQSIALDPQAAEVACKTPLVHVFDVSAETQKHHRFPDTAKLLATFEPLDRVKLLDFEHDGRRIGIAADDWATAKAVLEHARATMTLHQPRLVCFAPEKPRVLEVKPAKKPPAPAP